MSDCHIVVITGASGAGKTTAVEALATARVPGVSCFYFDSIGVPSAEVMERDFGSGENWQAFATADWLERLSTLTDDVRVAVLDGQTRPSVVFEAADRASRRAVHVVLLDCSMEVRSMRLSGARRQPELASERMNNWAAYLRGQADALHLDVIDTTSLTVAEVATRLEALVRRMIA
jgi:RNase adaptor protein for sRNA GlmZ degradation